MSLDRASMNGNVVNPTLLMTIEEVAVQLRIGRTRTYQLVMGGQIRSVTIGRRRLVPRESLEDFVTTLIAAQKSGTRGDE